VASSKIIVVDDDEDAAGLLAELLQRRGYQAVAVTSGKHCLDYLRSHLADVVITDVHMPAMSGIALCRELHERHPDLAAIVLTGVADLERAVGAIRAGAFDFLTKPVKLEPLEASIKRALEHLASRRDVKRLRAAPEITIDGILGKSPAIQVTLGLIRRVAPSDATVLVTGESGTGKELVARALHNYSPRAAAPFLTVNCAAVPGQLLESELFGHVRGAFTDAHRARTGLFVQAGAGTLFLDEIGELPLALQVKLLRALQERRVRPVGADEEIPFACRIVAATNRNLERDVQAKRFREDLFYRINVVVIEVPPLRERKEDILDLAEHFLAKAAERTHRPPLELSPAAARQLTDYLWPGNVRELQNSIERAVAFGCGLRIEVSDLPEKVAKFDARHITVPFDTAEELITLDELHRRYVREVLVAVSGNKSRAAKLLGVDRRSLYRRLEETREGPGAFPKKPTA
jgi:two-component system response regulator HydG